MTAAAAAVQSLLQQLQHSESLDEELMEYVCSVVEDPDPETSLELLVGVLAECVPAFSALCSETQAQLVLQLLDDANMPTAQACSSAAPGGPDDSQQVQAVVAALSQAKLQSSPGLPDACSDITNTQAAAAGSRSSSSDSSTHKKGPDLGPLLELCPGVSSGFLQHQLQHHLQGDLQAAANWLLESDPAQLRRQQQAWELIVEKKLQKKLIVEKFDLRVVSDGSSGGGGGGRKGSRQQGPDLLSGPKKVQQQESKLRYRDGRVVSTKGEKVIIEKVGEEWDGGSRGKVFTKGKRGKGFH